MPDEKRWNNFVQQIDGKITMDREFGYTAKFVNPHLDRHLCSICNYPMKNPVQTECGHLFCRACLEPVLRSHNPLCPIENSPVSRDTVRTPPPTLLTYRTSLYTYMSNTISVEIYIL